MKRLFVIISLLSIIFGLNFLINFEGDINKLVLWWRNITTDSPTLPLSAYKTRFELSENLVTKARNEIIINDGRLFWKGYGAKATVILDDTGKVDEVLLLDKGSGYSDEVKVAAKGANGEKFEFGNIEIVDGAIKSIDIIESSNWTTEPLVFKIGENKPYTGKGLLKYYSGITTIETPYLKGRVHGRVKGYTTKGLPEFEKDYENGKKQGTHIYWHPIPLDPSDYEPKINSKGDKSPTLWLHLKDKASEEFNDPDKIKNYVISNFRQEGGSFQVKLLEHWEQDLKNGLFEAFDEKGNKKYKDDFKLGKRIKHQIFDKQK